ncbi:MAG: HAMP domain-containing protein [Chloroflexi bacterium]|nr:HAMP domain-containing protein [Chloroflexota bacterium]
MHRFRPSFRTKVALLLCAVILVLGLTGIFNARRDISRILGAELEERGYAIANDLASNGAGLMLTGDLVALHDMVNRTMSNNPDVRYILVSDMRGQLEVSSFGNTIPDGLLEANTLPEGVTSQMRRILTEEGLIRDVAVSILDGGVGSVRIGMSDQAVISAVSDNSTTLILLVAIAVGGSFVVVYWLSHILTRPLAQLVIAVQRVAEGDLSQRIRYPATDEVGQLGRSFNTMAQELETQETDRRLLMNKVITSQEEERKRVARELHDDLAQRLTSVLLSLEIAELKMRSGNLNGDNPFVGARRETEDALEGTRKLIADLRPTVLDDLGLVPAIRSVADGHLSKTGTRVKLSAKGFSEKLAPEVETTAFRIVQEAITNIARHSQARNATIDLKLFDGSLQGEISDDGVGFDSQDINLRAMAFGEGLGLQGMRERASLLGGSLSLSAGKGRGTRVSFSIPV